MQRRMGDLTLGNFLNPVAGILEPISNIATAWITKDVMKDQNKLAKRQLKIDQMQSDAQMRQGQDWMKVAIYAGSLLAAGLIVAMIVRKK